MWHLLDLFFLLFHSSFILFNLLGWAWRPTRKLNLVSLLLTGFSWTVLGLFYGFGYCPFTDWHFQVLDRLGAQTSHSSYIQYLAARVVGIEMPPLAVDTITLVVYLLCLGLSLYVNIVYYKPSRK